MGGVNGGQRSVCPSAVLPMFWSVQILAQGDVRSPAVQPAEAAAAANQQQQPGEQQRKQEAVMQKDRVSPGLSPLFSVSLF